MIQRGGQVVLHMLANVQQKTIKPIVEAVVTKGSQLYTSSRLANGAHPSLEERRAAAGGTARPR
jgi:hypothetical protein